LGPLGRGQSDSPAATSIVLKDTSSSGTKPQVTPFVLKKLLISFSFKKPLFFD
jgi:hypothetical protein